MDEGDYKAMNELKMSKTEEINKLSAELGQLFENNSDCYADTWLDIGIEMQQGEVIQAMTKEKFIKGAESFASMRVGQERKDKNAIIEQVKFLLEKNGELEQKVKELKQEIYFLNNSSNFQ